MKISELEIFKKKATFFWDSKKFPISFCTEPEWPCSEHQLNSCEARQIALVEFGYSDKMRPSERWKPSKIGRSSNSEIEFSRTDRQTWQADRLGISRAPYPQELFGILPERHLLFQGFHLSFSWLWTSWGLSGILRKPEGLLSTRETHAKLETEPKTRRTLGKETQLQKVIIFPFPREQTRRWKLRRRTKNQPAYQRIFSKKLKFFQRLRFRMRNRIPLQSLLFDARVAEDEGSSANRI